MSAGNTPGKILLLPPKSTLYQKEKTMAKRSYEMDMCSGSILSKMLLFTLPLMASSILQLLFNAADTIVVGKFAGDHALAAVGSNGPLINLLVNFFMGLSVGANVLVSSCFMNFLSLLSSNIRS